MSYGIRELWLSMNTVLFQTVCEWTSTLIRIIHIALISPSATGGRGVPPLNDFFSPYIVVASLKLKKRNKERTIETITLILKNGQLSSPLS